MKYIFTIWFFCFWGLTVMAEGGIIFETSFDKAIQRAKKEHKIIFMDSYTTWCRPCKKLDKEVFSNEKVAAFFNEQFVNLKMDMEKGEGPALAERYHIFVYPTLLFFDMNGKEVHRETGFFSPESFLGVGKEALDPARRSSSMDERFANGDRDPGFLLEYAKSLYDGRKSGYQEVTYEFLKSHNDWNNEMDLRLILKMTESVDSPMFDYLIHHQDEFLKYVNEYQLKGRIDALIRSSIYKLGDNPDFDKVDAVFAKAYPKKGARLADQYRIRYFVEHEDFDAFAKVAIGYVKKYKVRDWEELNELAWNFSQSVDDRKQLKKAVKWAKCSIKQDPNFFNHETLTLLYYKLKKKKKALKSAKKALAYAKKEGEDGSTIEELITKIEQL